MIFRFIVLGISLAAAILPWPAGRRQNAPASRPAETGAIEKEPGDLLSQLEAWLAQHGRPAAEPQDGNGSDGSGPGTRGVPVPDDVISREFSFLNGPDADAPGDVLSREFSFLNGPDADAPSDVISREFSFVNETPRDATDVVSREFSYYVPTIDLRVSSIAAVASADIGARIDLEWTVINAGAETASGSWVDQVYVSTDAVLDAADVLVASRTVTRVVLPGDSYTRYATIFLPPTPGDYHILVVVDATNQLFEAEAEVNNTGERPIQVVTAPLADLFVAGIAPPASLEPGLPQAVSWTVENRSPDAIAHGSWTETVHYSSDGTIGCDTLVGSFSYSGDLAAGASILRTELITLPAGTVLGTGWLVLCVDTTSSPWPYHEVLEVDESNNCTIQQICVDCLQPDLAVTATATISDATAGDTIVVEYSVSNSGQEPTVGTWRDAIYLSTDDQLGPSDVQLRLDTISRPALLPGESYSISRSVTLPASTPNGVMRIVVRTDDSAAQVDLQRSNNVRASAELAVTALPLPDLEAQAVQLTPPDIAAFGDTITVEWMAANVGTAAALSPWSDRIFLSSDALLSPDDRPLGTPVNSNAHPLNPGDPPYAGSADVVLAYDRTPVEGNYYVLAVIDANGAVGELDESNNVIASLPIYLTVPPLPNLAVTITQAPGLVRVGESAHVEWRVTNAGNQPISQTDAFLLAVQVSGDAGIGADSTLVLIPSGAPFAADESREYSADVTVPELSTAELRFVVCADTSNEVIEAVEVDNCTIAETASVYGRPDLTVSSVSAPPVAIAGSTAVVTLTVSNDGNATARPFWIDGVYLSHDNAVGEDTLVGVATRSGALTSPGAYDVPVSISIPNTFEGEYRVVAEVDRGDRVIEIGIPTNNFRVAAASLVISQPPRPNLVVSNISTPAAGLSGGRLMAEWTVSNSGGASLTGTWFERVYASRDGVFGPDDLLLGEFLEQNRTLAAADSYVAAHEVAYPSEPGPWRLIVRFDATDTVFEGLTGEADNLSIDDAMFDVATFTATAEADIVDAPAGTPVVISGVTSQAGSGNPAPDVPVTVHVKTRGFDRKIIARTDATGHFQTTFSPTPNEGGRYDVSAGPAHEASPPATDQFRLWALIVTPATLATRIVPNIPFAGQIQLENPGDLPETGIQISTSGAPASIQVNVTPPDGNSLPQLTTVSLPFTIVAISADPAPGPFDIVITSAQGATTHFTLDLTVGPAQPRLEAVARDLQGGVLRAAVSPGMRSFAQFRVRNIGGVETGPVLVTRSPTPAWISMATAQFLDSIMPGADGSVVLQFDPPATEPVGGAYTLTVTLRAGTSEIYVPLRIDVVSEWIGDLHVTATDQFTYYDAAAPNVDGARVSVYDARTNELIASALTDGNGQADFTGLAEAYYTIEGSAVQHSGYRATQFVRGGQSNSVEAFMPFEPVTYTWTVVPTEFEDQYRIVIDAVFETQVPWPVLTLTPMAVDGLSLPNPGQIDYEIHNIGLIQASNVRLSVSDGGVFDLTPLATNLGDMLPDARVTVPAIVSRTRDVDCGTALVSVCWDVPCGNRVYTFCIPALVYDHGCPGSPPTGGTPPGGSGDGGGGDSYFPPPTTSQSLPCNPCAIDCLLTATCLLPIPPIFELPCAIETVQGCIEDLILDSPDAWLPPAVDCIASGLECAGVISEELAERLNKLFCLCEIARDCRQNCDENRDCFPCGYGDIWRLLRDYVNNRGCFARGLDDPLSQYYRAQYVRVMDVLTAGWYLFGDPQWILVPSAETGLLDAWMTQFRALIADASDAGHAISVAERAALLGLNMPSNLPPDQVNAFLDRWNRTVEYNSQGIVDTGDLPPEWSADFIARDTFIELWERARDGVAASTADGFPNLLNGLFYAFNVLIADRSEVGEGVCARVRIQIDQTATVARSAFRATLEINNDGSDPLEAIDVDVQVLDDQGADATSRFGIFPPDLVGLSDVDGGGSIPGGGHSGSASWLIVPMDAAAPDGPRHYRVGGTFGYYLAGNYIQVVLQPTEITVLPNPSLQLQYFLEYVVYADDPFTPPPQVEPSRPFSLGLLVTNSGAGTARNLRITSAEPQIVENERNLLIDFDIIGTQVGTQPVSPSLTVELGDVGPGDTAAARWLFISSLQGEFIAYDATFEHLTGLGDPRLSLIDSVDIFSLNHVVLADDPDDAMPDFLTDDIPDVGDLPDRLHRSNGTVDPVSVVTNPNVMADVPNLSVAVTAAIGGGWTYVRFDDPIPPGYELASVTRGDGQLLLLNYNAWQTDRINRFLPGSPRERYVHLFDHGGPGTYTIQYRRHCIGDLDQDGSVGINDLSILLSFFGTADGATPERGDLDEDGDIDLGDLALLLSRFGSMCY